MVNRLRTGGHEGDGLQAADRALKEEFGLTPEECNSLSPGKLPDMIQPGRRFCDENLEHLAEYFLFLPKNGEAVILTSF